MARPVRNAAVKARELIAKGYGIEVVDSIGNEGMSPAEEDLLNEEILRDSPPPQGYTSMYDPIDDGASHQNAHEPTCFKTYEDIDVLPSVVKFKPVRTPGPHLAERISRAGMSKFTKAIDFFELFFDDTVMNMIVENTNTYGWMHVLDKPSYGKKRDGSWEEVCLQEMRNYIAVIIFMGFAGRKDIERNWSQATLYSGGWARRFLSRNRFQAINGMLHISHPGHVDAQDKLTKIRPLLEHMRTACANFFQPPHSISVDERMVKSKGRSPIRQYMPDKPTKFGYKLWCVCDAITGYTCDFSVYTGRYEGKSKNGLGYDVVTSLVDKYKDEGYRVYCDNFFTSKHLAEHLLANKTLMCGTMRTWRRHFPQILKDTTWSKKASKGEMRYIRCDDVLFLQWMDKKLVTMISTLHKGHESLLRIRHGKDTDGQYLPDTVHIPRCVSDYNHNMGGVDLADQLIEAYNCLVKSVRWWKTLFFHMVDVAIVNGYILFQEWRKANPDYIPLQRKAGYRHINFREELVRQLARIADEEEPPLYTHPCKRRKSLILTGPHDPQYTDVRRNCKVCYILFNKQIKSYIKCSDDSCNVYLCLNKVRNCFPIWHSKEFDKYRTHRHSCSSLP